MKDSTKKLIIDLKEKREVKIVNDLIKLGVLDMNVFFKGIFEENDKNLYREACRIENFPLHNLVRGLIFRETDKEYKWACLMELIEMVPDDLKKEILNAFIENAKTNGDSKKLLAQLVVYFPDNEELINTIVDTQDPIIIFHALENLKFSNERLVEGFIQYANNKCVLEDFFKVIAYSDIKYTARLIMCAGGLSLDPKCLRRVRDSLDLETNNSIYLKFLFFYLNRELENAYRYAPEKILDKIIWIQYSVRFKKDLLKEILDIGRDIMKTIGQYPSFIASLNEEERFEHLKRLYSAGDFETIRNNRELFGEMFEENRNRGRK